MKGGVMWRKRCIGFWGLCLVSASLFWACLGIGGSLSIVYAAEPIAQMPLSEFKGLIVRVDKLQQREKLQAELIGHLQEKDKVKTDYITKIEQANETIQAYASKLEEVNAQLVKQAKDKQLSTLAEGAGYGATAAAVIGVVVRKLILKF